MNVLLNFIVNVLLMTFAIFSVGELIYDKSKEGHFINKIRRGGWFLIIIALLSVVFNFYKDFISEHRQMMSDNAKAKSDSLFHASQIEIANLQVSTKDSIIKKVDETYIYSIKASNEALAKYNLEITDSLHSVINKLKLNTLRPQLRLAPLEKGYQSVFLNKERTILNMQFKSNGGTSYNIKMYYYFIKITDIGYRILYSDILFHGETFITDEVKTTAPINELPPILDDPDILIFLTGSFTKDPEGKINVPYNEAISFNFKENKFIAKLDMSFEQLKKDLNINSIKIK